MEYLKEEETPAQKILFTGLDDAGKTSIILALQREFSKIAVISPTRGAQRDKFWYLGKYWVAWDLGGQQVYRISYLRNPNKYFDNTEIAIYVIDVQNEKRHEESISYLEDVIQEFKKLKIGPPMYIFFHKFDPNLGKTRDEQIKEKAIRLKERIKKINYEHLFFYRTSIFNFISLMTPMSKIMLELHPQAELMDKTIQDFAIKLNSEAILLIDSSSLILGSYYNNQPAKKLLHKSLPNIMVLNDSLQDEGESYPEDQIVIHMFKKYILFKQIVIDESPYPNYLLLLKKDNPWDLYFSSKEYEAFIRVINEILKPT